MKPPRRVVTKLRNVVFVPAMGLLPQEHGGSVNFSWVAADAGGRAADVCGRGSLPSSTAGQRAEMLLPRFDICILGHLHATPIG